MNLIWGQTVQHGQNVMWWNNEYDNWNTAVLNIDHTPCCSIGFDLVLFKLSPDQLKAEKYINPSCACPDYNLNPDAVITSWWRRQCVRNILTLKHIEKQSCVASLHFLGIFKVVEHNKLLKLKELQTCVTHLTLHLSLSVEWGDRLSSFCPSGTGFLWKAIPILILLLVFKRFSSFQIILRLNKPVDYHAKPVWLFHCCSGGGGGVKLWPTLPRFHLFCLPRKQVLLYFPA